MAQDALSKEQRESRYEVWSSCKIHHFIANEINWLKNCNPNPAGISLACQGFTFENIFIAHILYVL